MSSHSLVEILEDGYKCNHLVKSKCGKIYTGFTSYSLLAAGGSFLFMNGNRAVHPSIVASRVEDNLRRRREGRNLADFGQISLIVVVDMPPEWLVMDGQHRLETMRTLLSEHGVDVDFQFRVQVVQTEAEARMLYQDQSLPDPRTFLADRAQTALAENVIERSRVEFPAEEPWIAAEPTFGRLQPGIRVGDPRRPFLTEAILFGVLGGTGPLRDAATFEGVISRLNAASEVLKSRGVDSLGEGATENMCSRAVSLVLGFLRDGKLTYEDISAEVDALVAFQEEMAAVVGAAVRAARAEQEQRRRQEQAARASSTADTLSSVAHSRPLILSKRERVLYHCKREDAYHDAVIVGVHFDDGPVVPYYTVRYTKDGAERERQTDRDRLTPLPPAVKQDEDRRAMLNKKERVLYHNQKEDTYHDAVVVGVHFDDDPVDPYYTVRYENEGVEMEKQTVRGRLACLPKQDC